MNRSSLPSWMALAVCISCGAALLSGTGCSSTRLSPGPRDIGVYIGVEPPYLEIADLVIRDEVHGGPRNWEQAFRAGFCGQVRAYMQRRYDSATRPISLHVSVVKTWAEPAAAPPPSDRDVDDPLNSLGWFLLLRVGVPIATLTFVPFYADGNTRYQIWFSDVGDKSGAPSQVVFLDMREEYLLSLWPQGLLLEARGNSFSEHVFGRKRGLDAAGMMEGRTCARLLMRTFALWAADKQRHPAPPN